MSNVTSRPKAVKADVKRSAPVQSLDSRQHPNVGTAMPALLANAISAHERRDGSDNDLWTLANATSLVPPSTPEEALMQACLLFDDADPDATKDREDLRRICQRALGLAMWIETRFGIDRKKFRLDWFCGEMNERELFPTA